MSTTRAVLHFVIPGNPSPADTLVRTNAIIAPDLKRGMFVTAFYAILDARNRTLRCASAGHNPMVIARANGDIELLNPGGIAIGLDRGPVFQRTLREQEVRLHAGDRVVLYTDGVTETMNEKNEEYTDRRFHQFVSENRDLPGDEFIRLLLADLERHQGRAEQHDDITVVTFRMK